MIARGRQRIVMIEELLHRGIPSQEVEFILDHKTILDAGKDELLRHACPPHGWADFSSSAFLHINAWAHEQGSWALILCGPTGSGKTFAASWAVAMDRWKEHPWMQAIGSPTGTLKLQPCLVNEQVLARCIDNDLIERYSTCSFLVVDDIASETDPLRGFMMDRVLLVLYRRYDASLPTLFTTNSIVRSGDGELVDASFDDGASILQRYGFRMASRLTAHGQSPFRWCENAKDYRSDIHIHKQRMAYKAWKESMLAQKEKEEPREEPASEETRAVITKMIEDFVKQKRFPSQPVH